MENLNKYNYNGSEISFQLENRDVMVNLTEMAKSFGKLPGHFLSNEQTKQFIGALEERYTIGNPIVKTLEGRDGGTWAHHKLALKFAAWLNPKFELWVYDRIEELLKHGATAINTNDLLNPDFIINLATQLKLERAEKERLHTTVGLQAKELKESAPKVEYFNEVLQSVTLIVTNVIAKQLGMSATTLNKRLHNKGIIYKSGGTWVLYHKYENQGYTGTKTHPYIDKEGNERTSIQTYWTEKGRLFILGLIQNKHQLNLIQ